MRGGEASLVSGNTIDAQTNSIGVWFNHNDTTSSWTDGPVAGPNFYSEAFRADQNKDLAITGAVAANRNINHSLGGNIAWDGPGGLWVRSRLIKGEIDDPFDDRFHAINESMGHVFGDDAEAGLQQFLAAPSGRIPRILPAGGTHE